LVVVEYGHPLGVQLGGPSRAADVPPEVDDHGEEPAEQAHGHGDIMRDSVDH
jgi:hypothetical protein